MPQTHTPAQIIILNGAPRSGKSSIVSAIQDTFAGVRMNLGVDSWMAMTPARFRPGIGLRPGGERPELEPFVATLYCALYESIAAHSRLGVSVVVDVGHHDAYAIPREILPMCARILSGLPVLFVGVRCQIAIIMQRRHATGWHADRSAHAPIPAPIHRWQQEVHRPGIYDLEVDTSLLSPEGCADVIRHHLDAGLPTTAFQHLAAMTIPYE